MVNNSGYLFAGTMNGLFLSTNNGENWIERSNGLSSNMIISLAVNSTNMLLAGNYGGVYRSIDNGEYWSLRNDGLTNYSITSLIFNSSDIAFAGTMGDGVFHSINSTTSIEITNPEFPTTF